MRKLLFVFLILAVVGGTAFSFDGSTFPAPIGKGNVLISPTFHLGASIFTGFALGATVPVEFALPIPFALMVGFEPGVIFSTGALLSYYKPVIVPLLTRVSWHPNFEVRGLDPFVVAKVGYSLAFGKNYDYYDNWKWGGGFSYGINLGCRYFFNDFMGIVGELGYDRYGISYRYNSGRYSYRYTSYVYTFVHVGMTFKIGKSSGSSSSSSSSSSRNSGRYYRINADSLNVRSGPSADTAVVGQLTRDTRVEVLDKSAQWWKIKAEGFEGYVNSSYLVEDK